MLCGRQNLFAQRLLCSRLPHRLLVSKKLRNYLAFGHKENIYHIVLEEPQAFPSAQPTPLRESLGRPNQRGSKTSHASCGYPRCDLNLVSLLHLESLNDLGVAGMSQICSRFGRGWHENSPSRGRILSTTW